MRRGDYNLREPMEGVASLIKDLPIAVTGAYGFIGRRLVARLVAASARVTVITRRDQVEAPAEWGGKVSVLQCDLLASGTAGQVPWSEFDSVFHLAGKSFVPASFRDPVDDIQDNAVLTVALLDAIQRVSAPTKIIAASSAAVYGNVADIPVSEDVPLRPVSPYGLSKVTAEHYLRFFASTMRTRVAIARLFSVYGPGQRKLAVHDLISKVASSPQKIEVMGTGEEVRDFIHVDDVVDALLVILIQGNFGGTVYNVGTGIGTRVADLMTTICAAMNMRPECCYTNAVQPGYPSIWIADINRLKKLGFKPRVSLAVGVQSTAEWILARGAAPSATLPISR